MGSTRNCASRIEIATRLEMAYLPLIDHIAHDASTTPTEIHAWPKVVNGERGERLSYHAGECVDIKAVGADFVH